MHLCLRNDSWSFQLVHPLIRASGLQDFHHIKGRGLPFQQNPIRAVGIFGYVPFFNNASSVLAAVLEAAEVRVLCQPANFGRGAALRLAMDVVLHEFVLCCYATNRLPADFAVRALSWFEDRKVAAVVGLITHLNPQGVVSWWRARNLFKVGEIRLANKFSPLRAPRIINKTLDSGVIPNIIC